MTIRYF